MLRRSIFTRNAVALPTYAFYDFETTGLNPVFDQVVRSAFLKTAIDFDVKSRWEVQVRLSPDVIPSPSALVVNRLSMANIMLGDDEYTFMKKVHAAVNTPSTVSVGYNSLAFDDQFLRFGFWRNLLPVYTHQSANQCGRMDIYPMTVTYKLLCPEHLHWPKRKDEKVSFKLEEINQVNKLVSDGRAHDAMTDVYMTAALAKRLAAKNEMWNFCSRFFNKEVDQQQIKNNVNTIYIGNDPYKYGLMISHRGQGGVIVPVLLLGQSIAYPNQTIWLKLSNDALFSHPPKKTSSVLKKATIFRKKSGEPPFFIPLDGPVSDKIIAMDPSFVGVINQAFSWLSHNPDVFAAIKNHFLNLQHEKNDCDVNAQLYVSSFPSEREETLFQEFHEAALVDKPAIAEKFPRAEHRELALRLFGRNFPELLSAKNKKKFAQHLERVFSEDDNCVPVDHRGERQFSVSQAHREIKSLAKKDLDAEQREIVKDYEQWLSYASKNKMSFFAKSKDHSWSDANSMPDPFCVSKR